MEQIQISKKKLTLTWPFDTYIGGFASLWRKMKLSIVVLEQFIFQIERKKENNKMGSTSYL
jgi:hypothetical protein